MNTLEQTIKIGNPFSTLVRMKNRKSGEYLEIPNGTQIESRIINGSGREIAMCEFEICDQTQIKGGFYLKVGPSITADWKAGTAFGDIKINGKNSGNYSFTIDKRIT